MQETFSEWGKVFKISPPSIPPRNSFLKIFVTSPSSPSTFEPDIAQGKAEGEPDSLAQELSLLPLSQSLLQKQIFSTFTQEALTVNYSHPRYIEHSLLPEPIPAKRKPIAPILLLTAVSTFTAWYVYRLTGQKLELQTQVRNYADTLSHEKQAKAALISPHIKIITLQGNTAEAVSANIFWDTKSNSCLIYLNHLPQTAPNQHYQLWFLTTEEKFIKAKFFKTETSTAEVSLPLPTEKFESIEFVLLSLESSAQSSFPEGPILVKGLFR